MRSTKTVAVVLLAVAAALVLLPLGAHWFLRNALFGDVLRKEKQLQSPGVAQRAAHDLAMLCQTCRVNPAWFDDEPPLAPAWTPRFLLDLRPTWVNIHEDGARVEFGGGFHHFGYWLRPEPPSEHEDTTTTWILTFYSEDSPDRDVCTATMAAGDVISQSQFVQVAMAEFERRISAKGELHAHGRHRASVERCRFAMKHKQISELESAIQTTARANPDAWLDVLLAYLIDAPADAVGARERLYAWADSKREWQVWILAAYAFDRSGDAQAREQALSRALTYPVSDSDLLPWHVRYVGYPMCRRLYLEGKSDLCVKLCDTLLRYDGAGEHLELQIRTIRSAASGTASIAPTTAPRDPDAFDPFTGIDVQQLLERVSALNLPPGSQRPPNAPRK